MTFLQIHRSEEMLERLLTLGVPERALGAVREHLHAESEKCYAQLNKELKL